MWSMVVLAGHKFGKRISPSGPLVDAEAFRPLKIQLRPGWMALRSLCKTSASVWLVPAPGEALGSRLLPRRLPWSG